MSKLGSVAGLAFVLAACHAAKPPNPVPSPVTSPAAQATTAPAVQHKPARSDVDPDYARPPLAEMVQTRVNPCDVPPTTDPSPGEGQLPPGAPAPPGLLIRERLCRKPVRRGEPVPLF